MCKKSGCCCCFLTPEVLFLKSLFGFAGCCASVDGDGDVGVFFCQGTSANVGVYVGNEGSKRARMNCKTNIESSDIYSIVS